MPKQKKTAMNILSNPGVSWPLKRSSCLRSRKCVTYHNIIVTVKHFRVPANKSLIN